MSIYRILSLVLIFSFALLVGFQSGVNAGTPVQQPTAIAAMPFSTPPKSQHNILIIQVDQFDKPNVQLRSAWLLAYYENFARVDLFPLFPTQQQDRNLAIADTFYLTKEQKPSDSFWVQMQTFNTWWNGYIILDETATNELVKFLHPGEANTEIPRIEDIPLWYEDYTSAMVMQTQLYLTNVQKVAENSNQGELLPLLIALRQHARTDLNHQEIWHAIKLFQYHGENLICSFPTIRAAAP